MRLQGPAGVLDAVVVHEDHPLRLVPHRAALQEALVELEDRLHGVRGLGIGDALGMAGSWCHGKKQGKTTGEKMGKPWENYGTLWNTNKKQNKSLMKTSYGRFKLVGIQTNCGCMWLWSLNNGNMMMNTIYGRPIRVFNGFQTCNIKPWSKTIHGHQIVRGKSLFFNYEMKWEVVFVMFFLQISRESPPVT